MFDISPTLHESVSGPWLCPPGNPPVVDLYGMSVTLPVWFYTDTVLSLRTSWSAMVKYQDNTSQQALHINRPYLKANWPVVNINDLTWTLPVKMGNLPIFNLRVGNI